jgi:hypothetical protein
MSKAKAKSEARQEAKAEVGGKGTKNQGIVINKIGNRKR